MKQRLKTTHRTEEWILCENEQDQQLPSHTNPKEVQLNKNRGRKGDDATDFSEI